MHGSAGVIMHANFRHLARQAVDRAKTELASNDPERVKYAALELRFAMEAVTYNRALAFKAEIPPEEYSTWQPRQLIKVLHDIDPGIVMTSTIAFGLQDDTHPSGRPESMQIWGTDTVFTLKDLKAHYDVIGNNLHMPTFGQLEKGKIHDSVSLRQRCEAVISLLDAVLASRVFNATIAEFAYLEQCMRCKKPLRKRMPHGKAVIEATCLECKAEYIITDEGNGVVRWKPKQEYVPCQTPGCDQKMALWPDDIRPRVHWTCKGCGQHWEIQLSVGKVSPD
jgi:hypothetical protein